MKVKIGPYVNWVGPYQIAEKLLFWLDKHKDERVHKLGTWLAEDKNGNDTLLTKLCSWVYNKRARNIKIHIDRFDTYSMDSTLAYIVLPMLKQLKASKHGSPNIDDKDVPKELRSTEAPAKENEWDIDLNHHKRWDWVLDEIIWTFEQIHPDSNWEDQYHTGVIDMQWKESDHTYFNPLTQKEEKTFEMVKGPNDTHVFDKKGWTLHNKRIDNGLKLFGKYYRSLWD